MKGFSERNLKLMTQFCREYPHLLPIGQQPVAQLPWGHNVLLMQRVKSPTIRLWYMRETLQHGWSRNNDKLRHPVDNPSIGLILCQDRNRVVAEYALRGLQKPIGISEYEITRALPKDLKSSLPSIKEIEAELTQSEKSTAKPPATRKTRNRSNTTNRS